MAGSSRLLIALALLSAQLVPTSTTAQDGALTPDLLARLRFRSIGPAVMGGRIHDVEALPDDPSTIYVATASGGIWKSTNKGTTWTPLFDDQPVSTFGDLAIARSNPNVIWAGTGEQNNRQSTSWGNGVYRSTDGGLSWTHLGLAETRHIGRIQVHPDDADIAYVAALGNLWAPSEERGVYKTTDGGKSWNRVLYVDTLTGVVDLVMDPSNPEVLYAAAYQRLRRAWGFNGGGPGSGIYKTTDGGTSWRRLESGVPEGDLGRIGLAIAATNPQVLNATIQHATESGTYRSVNGGEAWARVDTINPRPMYYSHVYIDPTNADRVYVLATSFYKSEDGGRGLEMMPTRPTYDVGVHSDFHTLWIDPGDSRHFYLAGDAGLHETWDRGMTYIRINNFPIGQFYGVGVDMRDPYWIYGGMQDNHSWMGPSRTRHWIGIINDDWWQIGFGDGMYQQPDPTTYRYVYSNAQNGNLQRVDPETGDRLEITPHPPAGDSAYRFDWVTPSLISQHDPKVVYFGGNRLFISRDRGVSWERTADLTRRVLRDTLRLMGVLGADSMLSKNDGTASFGEITTIAESPLDPAILWVGTDDGNVQVSRDGGTSWTEVSRNVHDVPDGTYVSRVIASGLGAGVAYATFDAHRDGDFAPYVFRTGDFGQSWIPLMSGLPEDGSVNVIREHPKNSNLLFLGTEHGLFISADAGRNWTRFKSNLPTTLYDDLVIHPRDDDLVVATHGRSIWILDDLTPLVDWSPEIAAADVHLFPIRAATIFQYRKDTSYRGQAAYAGENPAAGAIVSYYLGRAVDAAAIEIRDAEGRIVRSFDVPAAPGVIHRVTWDLRHEPPPFDPDTARVQALPELPHPVTPAGPFVAPGVYAVTLIAGGVRYVRDVEVKSDPALDLTDRDLRAREDFLVAVLGMQRTAYEADKRAGSLRDELKAQLDSLEGKGELARTFEIRADSASALSRRLRRLRREIYTLAGEFNGAGVRQGSLYPPTRTHRRRKAILESTLERELAALERLEEGVGPSR